MNVLAGNLVYILSSLPHLKFSNSLEFKNAVNAILKGYASENDTLSLEKILNEETAKYVSQKESALFNKINLKTIHSQHFQKSNFPLLNNFSTFCFELKTKLQSFRNQKIETHQSTKNIGEYIDLKSGNPLETEIQLISLQWEEIETLSIGFYDDFNTLIAYKIKLLLLLRWWTFDETLGHEKYLKLINE